MLQYLACTAVKPFQGLTQLSVETHLNTDKAQLTLFKQQTKKPNQETREKGGGEEQETGEKALIVI